VIVTIRNIIGEKKCVLPGIMVHSWMMGSTVPQAFETFIAVIMECAIQVDPIVYVTIPGIGCQKRDAPYITLIKM
jgi:hypothetical protein